MKTFEWARVQHTDGNHTLSLLEVVDDGKSRQFWASILLFPHTRGDRYEFVAYNRDRMLNTCLEKIDTVEQAQESIEAYLMSEGVIDDGDIVEYLD